MKRLLLVLGSASLLSACGGKDDPPPLAERSLTGGEPGTTGGRSPTTSTRTNLGGSTHLAGAANAGGATSAGGVPNSGGVGAAGGFGMAGGAIGSGGAAFDGGTDSDGGIELLPIVNITNPPKDLNTPDEDGVIVDSTFDAVCVVQPSSVAATAAINKTSVSIELLDAQGKVAVNSASVPTQPTNNPNNPNEYTAHFTLTKDVLQSGRITFRCSASDQAVPPHTSQATVKTYVDYGPDIAFILPPKDGTPYPANQVVPIEFTVTPHALDTTDAKSAIADVLLRVHTATIATQPNTLGHYTAQIDFTDSKIFGTGVASGDIVSSVTATNHRAPKVATATKPIHIILDGTPPTTAFVDPTPAKDTVIGGTRKICFTATDNADGAGVNENTLTVKLDSTSYKYGQPIAASWTKPAAATYCFQFNSTDFPNSQSQVTIAVSVADLAGNIAPVLTRQLYLDNVPPFVSMDVPPIRVITHPSSTVTHCSASFDPLGIAADTASLQAASGLVRFRAFVWERTNYVQGQAVIYHSGVDQNNVHIYMRPVPDPTKPTPVEVNAIPDANNLCDSVADDLKTGAASVQTQLVPLISAQGSPDYSTTEYTTPPAIDGSICTAEATPPDRLCGQKASDLTFITYMNFASVSKENTLPAVYAVNASSDSASLTCTGSQWNISSAGAIPDGWVCVVAEAMDLVGNIGVSAPLPICLDHTNGANPPACAVSSMAAPDCAAGCKAPSRSLQGDLLGNQVVPYDVGSPIPFVVEYR